MLVKWLVKDICCLADWLASLSIRFQLSRNFQSGLWQRQQFHEYFAGSNENLFDQLCEI
jgi:hypothetical protein